MDDIFKGLTKEEIDNMSEDQARAYIKNNLTPDMIDKMSEEEATNYAKFLGHNSSQDTPNGQDTTEEPVKIDVTQPADISTLDRFKIKIFGTPKKSMEYIKQNYPGAEVMKGVGDQILIKMKGDDTYKALDPQTNIDFMHPSEMAKDIAESAYDVGAGIGTTVGSGLGAAVGSTLGPIGTMGGAVVGGGATAAGLEGLRQTIGKALGVANYDPIEAAYQGAYGTAAPLVFGAGGKIPFTAKSVTQIKGIPGIVWDALGGVREKLGSSFSGVPQEVIAFAKKGENLKNIDKFAKMSQQEQINYLDKWKEGIKDAFGNYKNAISQRYDEFFRNPANIENKFNLSEHINNLKSTVEDLETVAKEYPSDFNKEAAIKARNVFNNFFKEKVTNVPPQTPAIPPEMIGSSFQAPMKAAEELIPYTSLEDLPTSVSPKVAWNLKEKLKALGRTYKGGDFKSAVTPSEDAALKQLGAAYRQTSGKINRGMKSQYGTDFSALADDWKIMLDRERALNKTLTDPITGLKRILGTAPGAQSNATKIGAMDQELGTNIINKANEIRGASYLGNPGLSPLSGQARTSTSRDIALKVGGYGAGGMLADAAKIKGSPKRAIEAISAIGASSMGSPQAIKNYIKVGKFLEPVRQSIGVPASANIIWNLMQNKGE